ncbi:hypothetical protein H4582DRAFT_1895080 [Lactarius indigo]|nr:hypothetical protein H4582DRAFT_1895080 [Lactarius indigo]
MTHTLTAHPPPTSPVIDVHNSIIRISRRTLYRPAVSVPRHWLGVAASSGCGWKFPGVVWHEIHSKFLCVYARDERRSPSRQGYVGSRRWSSELSTVLSKSVSRDREMDTSATLDAPPKYNQICYLCRPSLGPSHLECAIPIYVFARLFFQMTLPWMILPDHVSNKLLC